MIRRTLQHAGIGAISSSFVRVWELLALLLLLFNFLHCSDTPISEVSFVDGPHSILGGSLDTYHSAVGAIIKNDTNSTHCSATLISDQWVLTAAHCVFGYDATELVFSLEAELSDPPQNVMDLSTLVVHPQYMHSAFVNDIALVRLLTPIDAASLPELPVLNDAELDASLVNDRVLFVGYGLTEENFSGVKRSATVPVSYLTETMFTARYDTIDETGVCNGDSGGPVFYQKDGEERLIGITSDMLTDEEASNPCIGTYSAVKVNKYQQWIASVLGDSAPSCIADTDQCFCNEACGSNGLCNNSICESLSCEEGYDCLAACAKDNASCMVNCYLSMYRDELTYLVDFINCTAANCSGSSTYLGITCAQENCSSSTNYCFQSDGCNLLGGDCNFGDACVYSRFGMTGCRESLMGEAGDRCNPSDDSIAQCKDGHSCASVNGTYICQQLCVTNDDCPSNAICQSGLVFGDNNEIRHCIEIDTNDSGGSGKCNYSTFKPINTIWLLFI